MAEDPRDKAIRDAVRDLFATATDDALEPRDACPGLVYPAEGVHRTCGKPLDSNPWCCFSCWQIYVAAPGDVIIHGVDDALIEAMINQP